MPAPENITQLVARFEEHRESYRLSKYNEAQLRREFLDPFLEALGWDVFNKHGYAEAYKEVIHEDSLRVEGATKAPDYAFRVGGQRKFFVEAKKPSVNIEHDIYPAFQLRRYSWSAKLPLGVVSDFEEFAIYDCRNKPDKKDKASTGRIAFYSFRDYIEKWNEIADVFSREAVLNGSFDKYAEDMKGRKGTTEVDDAFLAEIERWREVFARNFALRNPSLTTRELNYAVQMTIDRIIFLRICEDRGIERYEKLKEVSEQQNVYVGLCRLFQQADARYNSGLFHFKDEKDSSSSADTLTLSLRVDDKVLSEILGSLYYPESPYVFSEIPSDILGQVYERFLGKVIRLTAGHQAKVEEKPEVRKAGGVYYTPTYIVEYIVRNTVGKLIKGKTPREVSSLKILDPACGSGTFPLGAFQYLLDWHLKWYIENDPEKLSKGKNPAIFHSDKGWMLTTAEKKRILLNNIYGVDIDQQAVEVTKLSLLLKVLEGESEQTIGSQLALIQERALPDLGKNIKCGNSLIGPDYYEGHQLTMGFADDEERYRVNAFDWKAEFSQVFIQRGFDVVIGNPPYGGDVSDDIKSYLAKSYTTTQYKYDTFTFFIEKGIVNLKQNGVFGFIVPNTWLDTKSFSRLRNFILSNASIEKIVNLGKDVFNANIDTALVFISKEKKDDSVIQVIDASNYKKNKDRITLPIRTFEIEQKFWEKDVEKKFNVHTDPGELFVFEKIKRSSISLGDITDLSQGLIPYNTKEMSAKNPYISTNQESAEWKPFLDKGACISRYSLQWNSLYIKFGKWLYTSNKPKYYENDKILIQRHRNPSLARRIVATLDTERYYFKDNLCCVISNNQNSYDLRYLLGILNSFLLNNYYKKSYTEVSLNPVYLRKLPIHSINFADPADKARHDKMVSLVGRMLELHKQSAAVRSPQDKERLAREIESTDRRIDRLVYELYELTEDEIKIIESR